MTDENQVEDKKQKLEKQKLYPGLVYRLTYQAGDFDLNYSDPFSITWDSDDDQSGGSGGEGDKSEAESEGEDENNESEAEAEEQETEAEGENEGPDDEDQGEGDEDQDDETDNEDDEEDEVEDEDELGEPEPAFGIEDPDEPPNYLPGFTTTEGPNETTFNREFQSWYEFVTCVSNDSLIGWKCELKSWKVSDERLRFTGTNSMAEAVRMALYIGWPEGRKLLTDCLVAVRPRPQVVETWDFDVAGAFPCVPLFNAGDPQCMVHDPGSSQRNSKPVIRIDYNHGTSWHVSQEAIMLRGAAIVSLAESLEQRGFSTELRIVGNIYNTDYITRKKLIMRYSVVYKRAGEPLDLDRAAFAIAHPSCLRRFGFALEEQHPELEKSFCEDYGIPMFEANDPDDQTIFVAAPKDSRETPDSARRAVEQAADKVLNSLPEAAD